MSTKRNLVFRPLTTAIAVATVLFLSSCTFQNESEGQKGGGNQNYVFNNEKWSDEFNGTAVDTKNWGYDIGTGAERSLKGWGNNELQYYTNRSENVRVEDFPGGEGRGLVIEARKESYKGSDYTSARLLSQKLQSFTYGRIEARMKLPKGQGLWPAFWMLGENIDDVGWPVCGEIDIMEYRGGRPSEVHGTIHYGNPHTYKGEEYQLPSASFADSFHVFTIEWEAGKISWYVDGTLYSEQKEWTSSLSGANAPFDRPFFILINMAVGGNFLPNPPENADYFPQKLYVDWVRVYQ